MRLPHRTSGSLAERNPMTNNASASLLSGLLKHELSRAWKPILIRSICAIIFGAIALSWPVASLMALVFVYAVYAFAEGFTCIVAAIRGGGAQSRWWLVLGGIVSILAGIVAAALPGLTAYVFVILIGATAVVRGVMEIIGAIQMRKTADHTWLLALSGILSIVFGFILFISPGISALAITWVIGLWAVLIGITGVVYAFKLRKAA